jgi:hypothetical protein
MFFVIATRCRDSLRYLSPLRVSEILHNFRRSQLMTHYHVPPVIYLGINWRRVSLQPIVTLLSLDKEYIDHNTYSSTPFFASNPQEKTFACTFSLCCPKKSSGIGAFL